MLQRLETEGVPHFELGHLAAGAFGEHEELAVPAVEAGRHSHVLELGVVEVTQHGRLAGVIHRIVVIRAQPVLVRLGMAIDALIAAHEVGIGLDGRLDCRPPRRFEDDIQRNGNHDNG